MGRKKLLFFSNEKIEALAGKARMHFEKDANKYEDEVRPFLNTVVNLLGGKIESLSDNIFSPASLIIRKKNDFSILLVPFDTSLRDNFTIAHELGHYFLHYDAQTGEEEPITFYRQGSNKEEWQANRFAAAFLMPKIVFEKKYKELSADKSLLSSFFRVSVHAIEIRSKTLFND